MTQIAGERQWNARLSLRFRCVSPRTVLAHREHHGPLIVQKPLYPEGDAVCQCIVVHPPAGVVGGDCLRLDIDAGRSAWAQLTTPGAAKWYRCAAGAAASQTVRASVDAGGVLEWLPQGTIVYDGARGRSQTRIELAGDAMFFGSDVVALGRRASGERFSRGEWRQCIEIVRDGALIWSERAVLRAGGAMLLSRPGLNGSSVFGTFVAAARIDETIARMARGVAPVEGDGAISCVDDVLVARYRGDSMECATTYFTALWSLLRPAVTRRRAVPPRIWKT